MPIFCFPVSVFCWQLNSQTIRQSWNLKQTHRLRAVMLYYGSNLGDCSQSQSILKYQTKRGSFQFAAAISSLRPLNGLLNILTTA